MIAGGFSVITQGTWSEPVEGSGVSQKERRGEERYSGRPGPKRKVSRLCQTETECTPQGC